MKKLSPVQLGSLTIAAVAFMALIAPLAYAQTSTNSQVTQQINAGVTSTSIRNATGTVVASPSFAMSSRAVSTSQQTSTGTFGDNAQRITVDNPNGSTTGGAWTLALNATTPGTGVWTTGGGTPSTYPYNGTSAALGQLTVNPTPSTITAVMGGATGVTKGSQATFTGSTPITIMTASSSAAAIWNGYITGIGLSQTIPAGKGVGAYSISMTQTVTVQ